LDEEDFQRFPFFNQSEVVTTILDVGQGHRTQILKRAIQGKSHPSLV
jgi:hypothetical protein